MDKLLQVYNSKKRLNSSVLFKYEVPFETGLGAVRFHLLSEVSETF